MDGVEVVEESVTVVVDEVVGIVVVVDVVDVVVVVLGGLWGG